MRELPLNWITATLSELCNRIVDGSHNPPSSTEYGKPMLSARNIQKRRILFDNYRLIPEDAFMHEHRRTQAAPNDVLLTIVGTIGRIAIVQEDTPEFTLQRSVAVLKPNACLIPRFLAYGLESPRIQKQLSDNAKGTAQKGIYLNALGILEIAVAPFSEQKRIADKLDAVLARIDACRERLDSIPLILKRLRQSILAAATSGKLTEDWRMEKNLTDPIITSLGEWCDVLGGKRLPKGFELTKEDTGHPYVRVKDFETFSVKSDQLLFVPSEAAEVIKRYIINSDDVYISIAGTIGLVGQVPDAISGSNLTENAARIVVRKGFISRFLMYQLASPASQDQMQLLKIATTQDKLGLFRIKELELLMFSVNEQTEIVRRIESLFAFVDRLETSYATAYAQIESITPATLDKAFRGELVPQYPNDEPASALLQRIKSMRPVPVDKPKRVRITDSAYTPKKVVEKNNMTKSRQDDDVKNQPYLASHLSSLGGKADAETLFKVAELPVADFYKQLAWEVKQGIVVDNKTNFGLPNAA